ncbi:hypothetical protein [Atopomonas hussainii]|uniref:hypothetical protein n=1 Tax=Atopomonas hussainii TaxID=1429083 RepID=UPI0009429265|nr:hypothetical protein [Atopomonas hussainii]
MKLLLKFYISGTDWRAKLSRNEAMSWLWTFLVLGVGLGMSVLLLSLLFNGFDPEVSLVAIVMIMAGIILARLFVPRAREIHEKRRKERDPILFPDTAMTSNSLAIDAANLAISYGRKKQALSILRDEIKSNPGNLSAKELLNRIENTET